MTNLSDIYRTYEELLLDVEAEFNRVHGIFIDRMQCRKGCGSCCSQLFSISAIEAAYISKAVKALDLQEREAMRGKAKEYLEELLETPVVDTDSIESHSKAVSEALEKKVGREHIACPALEDEACVIYSHRPVIARKFGIPLWNPKKPDTLQACELNFKAGEIIEMDGLIEPQIKLEYRWLSFKSAVNEQQNLPDVVATVASAILFDYEKFLEGADSEAQ